MYFLKMYKGQRYDRAIGNGECFNLPSYTANWNLSLKINGFYCVRVYENRNCEGNGQWQEYTVTNQCKSTKLVGFNIVRSFRRC